MRHCRHVSVKDPAREYDSPRTVCQELRFTSVGQFGSLSGLRVPLQRISQRRNHLVDLILERVHFTRSLDSDEGAEVTSSGSGGNLSKRSHLRGQVVGLEENFSQIRSSVRKPERRLTMMLTLLVISCHVPSMSLTLAVTPRLPFVPTSWATLVTSAAKMLSWSINLGEHFVLLLINKGDPLCQSCC